MNKQDRKKIIAVLSMCFFSSANSWINPVMQLIMEAYPEFPVQTVRQISTLPALLSMFFVLAVGSLVGKKVRFLPVVSIGLFCIAVGGCMPFFFYKSFPLLILSRVILGTGVGCIGIRNGLVIKSFEEPLRTKVLGWVILAINAGAMIVQQLTGILGTFGLRYTFALYALSLIPLVLINLWLKEPAPEAKAEKSANGKRGKLIEKRVWLYMLTIFVIMMMLYPLQMGLSSYMAENRLGDSALAGTALSVYTLSGAILGLFYDKIQSISRKYIWAILFFPIAAGMFLVLRAQSAFMIIAGMFFAGVSNGATVVTMARFAGITAYSYSLALSVSLITAFGQLGNYASSFWISLCENLLPLFGDGYRATLAAGILISAVMTLISVIFDLRPREVRMDEKKG